MKHRVAGRRFDRTSEHRTAMFRNLMTSLLRYERIITTTPKAKDLKRFADKVITLGKKGTLHARRLAHRVVRDAEALAKLFGPIADRFKARAGGYTRIVRVGRRPGDNAEVAMIELVDRPATEEVEAKKAEASEKEKPAKKAKPAPKSKATSKPKPTTKEKAAPKSRTAKKEKQSGKRAPKKKAEGQTKRTGTAKPSKAKAGKGKQDK